MKRVLFTLCMVLSTILIMAGEKFTTGKYTFEITSPTEIELDEVDKSVSSVNLSPTITYQGTTYRVTSIGRGAFLDCTSLTSITIPNSVTSIGDGAFYRCESLTSITIPNSVTSVEWSAFKNCSSLTSVTIPNSVTSVEWSAFYGTGIYTNAANWKNGALYINNCLIKVKEDFMGDYAIKAGTRLIADGAFKGCTSLTSVTIPNSVTSIGDYAFEDCSSLTSIIIPNGVTKIGYEAFTCCESLTSVIIPNSVTSIENHAFRYCSSLTSVTIGNSVTSIEYGAFRYCSSLTSVKYTGTKGQWNKNKVKFNEYWAHDSKIQVIHCTDGEIRL